MKNCSERSMNVKNTLKKHNL